MLDFMVIGLPRSGTTWAANWLTTAATHCVHDPLRLARFPDWDQALPQPGKVCGVACTGAWARPAWLNAHPARKLVLHRALEQVAASLARLGLPAPTLGASAMLREVEGLHVPYTDLFDRAAAAAIWTHLTGLAFDGARHAALVEMNVQPAFATLRLDAHAVRGLVAELRGLAAEA